MAPHQTLKAWIGRAGISYAEAARRVDYDRSNFHRIVQGDAPPTLALAHAIEVMTDGEVRMCDWISRPAPVQQGEAA